MKTVRKKKSVVKVESVAKEAAPALAQPATPATVQPAPAKAALPGPARVALELLEPAASKVFVAGTFNGWKPEVTPLIPLGNGRWKGDLQLRPGRHEYLFVVDGQWRPDPNARETVANPFGGRNSVITISE